MTDILFDTDGDLLIENGDFSVGESLPQEVEDILISFPGFWKEFPLVGAGVPEWLGSPGNGQKLARTITVQLINDGKEVDALTTNMNADGTLTINVNGIQVDVSN